MQQEVIPPATAPLLHGGLGAAEPLTEGGQRVGGAQGRGGADEALHRSRKEGKALRSGGNSEAGSVVESLTESGAKASDGLMVRVPYFDLNDRYQRRYFDGET